MSAFTEFHWMIIVNPKAAHGKVGKRWPTLAAKIAGRLSNFEVVQTRHPGHATQLAQEAIAAGFRHIIAVGGDGTNHEVTNGILQQDLVPGTEIYYTLLPVGTGNDWIRTHRIPRRIDRWLDMLEAGHCVQQEAGLVRYWAGGQPAERYFVNVAGMAYDGFVVRYGEQHRGWVRNRFFYLLLILRCLFQYRLSRAIIWADGKQIDQYFYTINVGICRYSGGGMQLVPQADPDDGWLALTYAGPVSKLDILLSTWRFYNGSIGQHPKVETGQVRGLSVAVPEPELQIPLEADGEFLGYCPAEFSVIEKALTLVVPCPSGTKKC